MFLNIEKFLGETEFFLIFIEDLICSPYHIMDSLPEHCIRVTITGSGDGPRTITVERSDAE